MKVSSIYSGRYAKTKFGITNSLFKSIQWFLLFSILEIVRVLELNKYHYGNIFCLGHKLTDRYGRK